MDKLREKEKKKYFAGWHVHCPMNECSNNKRIEKKRFEEETVGKGKNIYGEEGGGAPSYEAKQGILRQEIY